MIYIYDNPLEYIGVVKIRTWHVAILCRNPYQPDQHYLLHLWSPDWNKENAIFRLDPLHCVVSYAYEIEHYRGIQPVFHPDEILYRAASLLGQGEYHLFQNNCQHAVSYILTGTAKSPDVETAKSAVTAIGFTAATLGAAFLILKAFESA